MDVDWIEQTRAGFQLPKLKLIRDPTGSHSQQIATVGGYLENHSFLLPLFRHGARSTGESDVTTGANHES